jgi:hypothetical protein
MGSALRVSFGAQNELQSIVQALAWWSNIKHDAEPRALCGSLSPRLLRMTVVATIKKRSMPLINSK